MLDRCICQPISGPLGLRYLQYQLTTLVSRGEILNALMPEALPASQLLTLLADQPHVQYVPRNYCNEDDISSMQCLTRICDKFDLH